MPKFMEKYLPVTVGFVVIKDGVEQTENLRKELVEFTYSKVPEYMAAREIYFLEDLPMNATGKVDIIKLEKMAEAISE